MSKGQKAKTEELKEYKEDQQNFEFHPDNKCSWYNLFQVRNSFTISITFLSLKILRKKYRQSTTDKFAHAFSLRQQTRKLHNGLQKRLLTKMASFAKGLNTFRAFSCQSVPIWSCHSNLWSPSSAIIPTLLTPKPTSMSPFLGVKFCSSLTTSPAEFSLEDHGVSVETVQGLPHLTVPLPSRNEPCIFVLKPITHTIGDLVMMLKTEDHGIDRVVIRSTDGIRMASTTSIQTLLKSDFDLVINDVAYHVQPPPFEPSVGVTTLSDEELQRMGDVRGLVGQLYEVKDIVSTKNFKILNLNFAGIERGRISSSTRAKTCSRA